MRLARAGVAIRDVGGARASRAGMRPETDLFRHAVACRSVPRSGVDHAVVAACL